MTIEAVEVTRDQYGCFYHPSLPDDIEAPDDFSAWQEENNLQVAVVSLYDDDALSDEQIGVFASWDDVTDWKPKMPEGDGWFVLAITHTDDGPQCFWARKNPFNLN